METCRACRAFLQPDWDRCKICGAERTDGEAEEWEPYASPGSATASEPRPVRPSSGASPLVIAAVVVGGLILVGALFFVLTKSGSDSDESDTVAVPTVVTTAPPAAAAAPDPNYAPRPQQAELDAFCAGAQPSVTGAGPYPGPAAPHVVQGSGATGELPGEWTAAWTDNSAKPIELVLCVTLVPGANQIPCDGYNTNTPVFLKDASYNAELKVAATGEVLASDSWVGVTDCPLQIYFEDGENPIVRHRQPEAGLGTALVQPFVAP